MPCASRTNGTRRQASFLRAGSMKISSSRAARRFMRSALRARILAEGRPYVRDLVLAGDNRQSVAALIFPDLEACRALIIDAGAPARTFPQAARGNPRASRRAAKIQRDPRASFWPRRRGRPSASPWPRSSCQTALARGWRNHRQGDAQPARRSRSPGRRRRGALYRRGLPSLHRERAAKLLFTLGSKRHRRVRRRLLKRRGHAMPLMLIPKTS